LRIIMLGPPGSGKGTQARIISELLDLPVVTTGDILRDAVIRDTEHGRIANEYMERGELVPDCVVNMVVRERLNMPDVKGGFILDGFPRSAAQADALDRILDEKCLRLDYVVHVSLDDEAIVARLSKRRICLNCGAVYHLKSKTPKKRGVCDVCGSRLVLREDDKPEVIRRRLEVYRENTMPLLERYKGLSVVREVPGDTPLDKLPGLLKKTLD
jgi:adenylate kinase